MSEKYTKRAPLDREVEQAIIALKKGAHLLKCGRRGKPKFCPFRLSTDETTLIRLSGEKEKQLKLKYVSKIVLGQKTVNFIRHLQPEKKSQSFSIIYQNGERSLDLICKDKEQADSWFLGLTALLSLSIHSLPLGDLKISRGTRSCANSSTTYTQRQHRLGLYENSPKFSQAKSVYGSPPQSMLDRFFSDNLPSSRSIPSSTQRTSSNIQFQLPHALSETLRITKDHDILTKRTSKISSADHNSSSEALKDVFMWGEGIGRYLDTDNHDSSSDALVPKLLQSAKMLEVCSISCGEKHIVISTKQGEVYSWGEDKGGRLGHKIGIDVPSPKLIESLKNINVQKVSCGSNHTCAVTNDGELYSWGHEIWFPKRILGTLHDIYVVSVACGEWHTALISSTEQLFTYGDGTFGALGHGDLQNVPCPKEVESLKGLRVKSVACGPWHTVAVVDVLASKRSTHSGKLFTWGDGDKGQLGHSDNERRLLPTCVASLVDSDFIRVSCGRVLTVALTVTGIVYTMGSAVHGQLGNPEAKEGSIGIVQGCLKCEFAKDISSGSFHVAVLTVKGKVYTWGKGENGRLGLGDNRDRSYPTLVDALEGRTVLNVSCGSSFTAVICSHKSVSSKDQLVCSRCHVLFGFTRKKHNCYNCGLVFCHSCSSRKAMNASLAPDKEKMHRVCDMCFIQLSKHVETKTNEQLLSPRTPLSLRTPESSMEENIDLIQRKESCVQDSFQSFLYKHERWGHVSCPYQFCGLDRENSNINVPTHDEDVHHTSGAYSQRGRMNLKQDLCETDKMLSEELNRLRIEAVHLAEKCNENSLKLCHYKGRIEDTWAVARNEAAKCKAAKDVINILTNQKNALLRKLGGEKQTEKLSDVNQTDIARPHDTRIHLPTPCSTEFQKHISDTKLLVKPITFEEETIQNQNSTNIEDTRQRGSRASKDEVVEKDEPGVYITLVALPSGKKALKRVRFSRRKFSGREAEQWWEENQSRVYLKYNIERIATSSNRSMTENSV